MLSECINYPHRSRRKGCPDCIPLLPSAGGWWGRCHSCDTQVAMAQGRVRDIDGDLWMLGEDIAERLETR